MLNYYPDFLFSVCVLVVKYFFYSFIDSNVLTRDCVCFLFCIRHILYSLTFVSYTQVLDNCGTPQYINAPYSKTSLYTKSVAPAPHVKVRLFSKMESAKLKVLTVKSFYEGLPEELCVVEELSARQEDSEDCWNGKSIGR